MTPTSRIIKGLACLVLICILSGPLLLPPHPALASDRRPSKIYNSKRVIVYYDNEKQLQELRKKIKPKSITRSLNRLFSGGNSGAKENLGLFLDILFQRVQTILEMPLPKQKVSIWVHPGIKELASFFKRKYGGPTARQTSMGARVSGPAFYVKKTNTIHLQVKNMRIGILAHEMAHAISENYFIIKPPARVAEIMSQHVDREISNGRF